MRGDLSETTLPAICRSLASDGATGRLLLDSVDGPGLVTLRGGAISDARSPQPRARLADRLTGGGHLDELTLARVLHELRDEAPASGTDPDAVSEVRLARALLEQGLVDPMPVEEIMVGQVIDALVELSGRRSGPYRFLPNEPGAAAPKGGAVLLDIEVALTGLRHRVELLAGLPRTTLRPDTVPHLLSEATVPGDQLDADALTVLAAIDDDRNLRELAELLGYGSYDLAIILADLYERGIVALTHPQDDIGAALDLALRSGEVEASPDDEGEPWHHGARSGTQQERDPDDDTVHGAKVADWVFEGPEEAWPAAGTAPADPEPSSPTPSSPTPSSPAPSSPTPAGEAGERVDHEDTDVSEFLRELSALALGDTTAPRGRTSTSPGTAPTSRHDRADDTDAAPPPAGRPDEESDPAAPQEPTRSPAVRKTTDEAAPGRDGGRKRRKGRFGRG